MRAGLDDFPACDIDAAVERAGDIWSDLAGANLFVTGGTGFLGAWLLATLLRADQALRLGLRITCLTRRAARFAARFPDLAGHPAVSVVEGDVRFFAFPPGRFTHLIHAAADTSAAADARPLDLMDSIVDGTRRVLAFAQMAGIRKMLFTSSGAVYGALPEGAPAFHEDMGVACRTDDPAANYGQSKRMAEQLCTLYHREMGIETKIARCFAFGGPQMEVDGHFAFGNFVRQAAMGEAIQVAGDGTPLRTYLYAGDAAAWLLRILVRGRPGTIYNVGSDQPVSIGELAERAARVLPGCPGVNVAGQALGQARSRYVPSVERARTELGLDVWTGLDEMILRTAEWLRSRAARPTPPAAPFKPKRFVIDVDGVVASLTPGNDYTLAEPLVQTIAAINALYDAGHRIIMFTARGYMTGIDWRAVTERQFSRWGLKYHELHFGKPAADYYIDDKLISGAELEKLARTLSEQPEAANA